jgi:AsmA protein
MSRSLKIILITTAAFILLAALAVFLLTRVDTKSRFETVATEATGLEVVVNGNVSIHLFPTLHVVLQDVILRNQQAQIASVNQANIGVEFWPLFRKQVRITRMELQNANIEIERNRNGIFNFVNPSRVEHSIGPLILGHVLLTKATFHYANQQSNKEIKASDCNLDGNDVQTSEGHSADIMKSLSLEAHVVCAELRNNLFVGTDVNFSVTGKRGKFKFTPVTMQLVGGKGTGDIDADFSGTLPAYRIHYAVAQLQVAELFRSLAPARAGEGLLDFTAELSMRGFDADEMTRTATGEASLHGENIQLAIGNLDEKLAHYESSQNFNLVDVGAFFIAGPLGTVVTKGYNFSSIFKDTHGNTQVRNLVSQWKVENGIAHAQDVALATKENRLAMKGALDFVNREFDDVTIAFLDDQGCALVEQKIIGPFRKPEIEKANVLVSLTGPISNLVGRAKKLVGVKCAVFYAGSIPR